MFWKKKEKVLFPDEALEGLVQKMCNEGYHWLSNPYFAPFFNIHKHREEYFEKIGDPFTWGQEETLKFYLTQLFHNQFCSQEICLNFSNLISHENMENEISELIDRNSHKANEYLKQVNLADPFEDGHTENLLDRAAYLDFASGARLQLLLQAIRNVKKINDKKIWDAFSNSNQDLLVNLLSILSKEYTEQYLRDVEDDLAA